MEKATFTTSLGVDLRIAFNQGIQSRANSAYTQLIEIVPSSSNAKREIFYGDNPLMQRWRGERQAKEFREYRLTLNGDDWEATRKFKRSEINRDQSGGILINKVRNFGEAVEVTKEKEFWEFLHRGTTTTYLGFDRATFFSTSHYYVDSRGVTFGSAAQSNVHYGGSQLDSTTLRLDQAAFANYKTDQDLFWGLQLTHVAVRRGSLNAKSAKELANSQFTVEANTVKGTYTENVFKGAFDIIEFVYGFGDTEWLSFALNMPEFKPVKVLSETQNPGYNNPEFTVAGLDPSNETDSSFDRDEVKIGVKSFWDYNPGYWMTAYLHGSTLYNFTPADLTRDRIAQPNTW